MRVKQDGICMLCFPACDCDPVGAVGRGECQMEEDPVRNLRAGECICKENVNGVRCDRCKDGFFNLQQDNLQGCEGKWYNSIDGEGGVDCSGDDGDDGGNDNGDYFDGGGYGNQ